MARQLRNDADPVDDESQSQVFSRARPSYFPSPQRPHLLFIYLFIFALDIVRVFTRTRIKMPICVPTIPKRMVKWEPVIMRASDRRSPEGVENELLNKQEKWPGSARTEMINPGSKALQARFLKPCLPRSPLKAVYDAACCSLHQPC